MPRLTPVPWKTLECVFLNDGFAFERQVGSHRSYTKEGVARPVVIPAHGEVTVGVIMSNLRTACMPREKYFRLLAECK